MDGVLKRVTPLEDFILEAEFTGGVVKRYDVKPLFDEIPEFEKMRDNPELFCRAEVSCCGYGVVWDDTLDLASEELWDKPARAKCSCRFFAAGIYAGHDLYLNLWVRPFRNTMEDTRPSTSSTESRTVSMYTFRISGETL